MHSIHSPVGKVYNYFKKVYITTAWWRDLACAMRTYHWNAAKYTCEENSFTCLISYNFYGVKLNTSLFVFTKIFIYLFIYLLFIIYLFVFFIFYSFIYLCVYLFSSVVSKSVSQS